MNDKQKQTIKVAQIAAIIIILLVAVYSIYILKSNPGIPLEQRIISIVSPNKFIAFIEFVIMYILKGISLFFPSSLITVAAGIVFGFPQVIIVSMVGILTEFFIMFLVGRLLGKGLIDSLEEKYPAVKQVTSFQEGNGIFISFIIRITGLISYDVGSMYLGASEVNFIDFLIGSMLGALLNTVLYGMFGSFMFDPLSWKLWAVVFIRICAIAAAFVFKKKMTKNNDY